MTERQSKKNNRTFQRKNNIFFAKTCIFTFFFVILRGRIIDTGQIPINTNRLTLNRNHMKKHFLKSFVLLAMLFSALSMSAKKYCHEPLTLNGGATIYLSCELISDGQYRITIEGENLAGLGGSFYNPGAVDLRTAVTTTTTTKIVCDIEAASAPTLYTPLYVLCPGEQNIGWPNDIDWTGTCGEGGEESDQTPDPEDPEVTDKWASLNWLGNGSGLPENTDKYKISQNCLQEVVNIQKPGWADEPGIYVVAPGAIESCSVNGAIQGGGMVLYLSSFTAKETEVTINYAGGSCTFWVYYADGTEGGSEGGEEPDPTPTPDPEETIITYTYFAPNWQEETNSSATYDANTGTITVDLKSQFNGQWQAQVKVKHDIDFSADKYYQFSAKFHANTAVGGVTIKVDDNNGMIFENASVNLPANEDYIYTSAAVKGVPGNNKIIVFDFGLAPTCQITISDIVIQEVESTTPDEPAEPEVVESNYCQNTLINGANSIDLTCEKVSVGNYRVIIEGDNLSNISSGTYLYKNKNNQGDGNFQLVSTITSSTATKIVCEFEAIDPEFYTPLYVMMPGEVNYGTISDVIWGTCPEAEEDDQAPTMTSAIVESYTHNSAVIAVVAEDNIGVAKYQIVDAGNSVDQTLTATDGKITLSGLASATTYNLTIYAIDKAGNKSAGLPVTAFTTDALVYCDFPTGNNGDANYGNPNGRCLLTLTKLGNTQIRITVKPNYANGAMNQIDYLYVISTGGTPYPAEEGADAATGYDELSVDITYASAPTTYAFTIQWSNPDWNGRWEINLNEILESNLCPLPTDEEAPVMVSASLVTGSETYNSAVLTVSATDNDEVANYHVIDATNGYDATIAPVGNQITLTGLTPSTSYNFTVTALDLAGNESENSKTVAVSTHKLEYCEWIIGSENRTDWADANRLCLLTISKITDKQLLVVAKPVSGASKLDFLQVQADGAPHQTVTSPAADELSIVLDFANTITEIPLFRILWSNEDVEENWMTDLKNVKASYLCPHIELGESVDLSKLDLSAGVTTDVKITRKFVTGSNKWNTLSLPFALTESEIDDVFGTAARVVELTGATKTTPTDIDLTVSSVANIVAGKPYLIQLPASYAPVVLENITLSNTVTAQETATANGLAKMVSVLTPIAFDDAAGGIRFFLNTNGKLSYRSTTNGMMNPYRAYFEFPHINDPATASQVRARVVFNENTETGVDNLITTDAPAKVIENGQLIIIRGGVKYNVQGQKL